MANLRGLPAHGMQSLENSSCGDHFLSCFRIGTSGLVECWLKACGMDRSALSNAIEMYELAAMSFGIYKSTRPTDSNRSHHLPGVERLLVCVAHLRHVYSSIVIASCTISSDQTLNPAVYKSWVPPWVLLRTNFTIKRTGLRKWPSRIYPLSC